MTTAQQKFDEHMRQAELALDRTKWPLPPPGYDYTHIKARQQEIAIEHLIMAVRVLESRVDMGADND